METPTRKPGAPKGNQNARKTVHKHTPTVGIGMPEDLLARLRKRAETDGKSIGKIVREALEAYL